MGCWTDNTGFLLNSRDPKGKLIGLVGKLLDEDIDHNDEKGWTDADRHLFGKRTTFPPNSFSC